MSFSLESIFNIFFEEKNDFGIVPLLKEKYRIPIPVKSQYYFFVGNANSSFHMYGGAIFTDTVSVITKEIWEGPAKARQRFFRYEDETSKKSKACRKRLWENFLKNPNEIDKLGEKIQEKFEGKIDLEIAENLSNCFIKCLKQYCVPARTIEVIEEYLDKDFSKTVTWMVVYALIGCDFSTILDQFLSSKKEKRNNEQNEQLKKGMHIPRYTNFDISGLVYRQSLEAELINKLDKSRTVGVIGGPGRGKTTLLKQYVHSRLGKEYSCCHFLDCETEASFKDSLNIKEIDPKSNLQEVCYKIINSIQIPAGKRMTVIFDNITYDQLSVERTHFEKKIKEIIDDLSVNTERIDIFYTSRKSNIGRYPEIPVEDFEKEEAWQYLKQGTCFLINPEEENAISFYLEKYGRLAITLSLLKSLANELGGYTRVKSIHQHSSSGENTLDDLLSELFSVLCANSNKNSQIFGMLLKVSSLLSPTKITRTLLDDIFGELDVTEDELTNSIEEFCSKINILEKRENDTYAIHRSYQEAIINSVMSKGEAKVFVRAIVNALNKSVNYLNYFGYTQQEDVQKIEDHVERLFNLNIGDTRGLLRELLLACAYNRGRFSCEDPIYKIYFEYLQTQDSLFHQAMSFCDNAIVTANINKVSNEELLDTVNGCWECIEAKFDEEDVEYKILKVRILFAKATLERESSNSAKAHAAIDECIEYSCLIKEGIEPDKKNVDLYMYFHGHWIMGKNVKCQIYRQIDSKFTEAIELNKEALEVDLEKFGKWRIFITDNHKKNLSFMKAQLHNAIAVNYIEQSKVNSYSTIFDAIDRYMKAYDIYYEKELWLLAENQIVNVSQAYRSAALKLPVELKGEDLCHKYLLLARYWLEAGLVLRKFVNADFAEFRRYYYNYRFNIAYNWIENIPSHETDFTLVDKMRLPQLPCEFATYEKFMTEFKANYIKDSEAETRLTFLEEANSNLQNAIKIITPALLDETIKIESVLDMLSSKYSAVMNVRYYGAFLRKAAEYTEDSEKKACLLENARTYICRALDGSKYCENTRGIRLAYKELFIVLEKQNKPDEEKIGLLQEMEKSFEGVDKESDLGEWYFNALKRFKLQ